MYPEELLQRAERLAHSMRKCTEEMRRRIEDADSRMRNQPAFNLPLTGNLPVFIGCERGIRL